jgi:tetratricopeptide (TPR) repeat protein
MSQEPKMRFRNALERFRDRDYSSAIQGWRELQVEGHELHNLELYLAVARREQARVLQVAEDYGADLEEAIAALEPESNAAEATRRARALLEEKRYGEASTALDAAAADQPDSFDLRLAQAQVQLLLGHFQDALFHLEQARLIDEGSGRLYSTFGAVLRELERPLEAEREYRRAVDLDSGDSTAWLGLARLYYDDERYDMTEGCLQKVLTLRPGSLHATTLLDEVRRKQDHTRTLIDEGLAILAEHPEYPDWHHRVAVHYSYTGEYDKAREHLNKALEINPRLAKSAYQLGMLEAQTGEFQAACAAFRRCLDSQDEEEGTEVRVARELEEADRFEEAAYQYSVSVAPTENRAGRHIELGKRLFAENFLPQARRELEQAVELQPGYPDARYVLGRVAAQEGKHAEAVGHLKKALELSPWYQAAALALAREELALGNVAAAKELWDQYGVEGRPDLRPGWAAVKDALDKAGG